MNLIAVNIGNTNISCACFIHGEIIDTWKHATKNVFAAAQSIYAKSEGLLVALCSVVPPALAEIDEFLSTRGVNTFVVSPLSNSIIEGIYSSMGADRLANAMAAWKLFGKNSPALALDLGTATTLTAISASGKFLGGFITLGLGSTLNALANDAALLPKVDIEGNTPFPLTLSFNTQTAIAHGTILAHVGLVTNWVNQAEKELTEKPILVATGGWAKTIQHYCQIVQSVDPFLTLKGIYLLAEAELDPKDRD